VRDINQSNASSAEVNNEWGLYIFYPLYVLVAWRATNLPQLNVFKPALTA